MKKIIFVSIIFLLILGNNISYGNDMDSSYYKNKKTLILEKNNYYQNIFDLFSLKYDKNIKNLDIETLKNYENIIISKQTEENLNFEEITNIAQHIKDGYNILFEKNSIFLDLFNIDYYDEFRYDNEYYIKDYEEIEFPLDMELEYVQIKEENIDKKIFSKKYNDVLCFSKEYKGGNIIYIATSLDIETKSKNIIPFIHSIIIDSFDLNIYNYRKDILVYIDYKNLKNIDPLKLTSSLKKAGVKEVNFSTFYEGDDYEKYINEFIILAHQNRMLVNAWFKLPMISKEFWNNNFDLRQKNGNLEYIYSDNYNDNDIDDELNNSIYNEYMYPMALENPICFEKALKSIDNKLNSHNWDGINIEGTNFTPQVFAITNKFNYTPMSDYFREEFKSEYNIDPISIFDESIDLNNRQELVPYIFKKRKELVQKINKKLYKHLVTNQTNLNIKTTQLDVLRYKDIGNSTGVDIDMLSELNKDFPLEFIIEQPNEYDFIQNLDIKNNIYTKLGYNNKQIYNISNIINKEGDNKEIYGSYLLTSIKNNRELFNNTAMHLNSVPFYYEYELIKHVGNKDINIVEEDNKYYLESKKTFYLKNMNPTKSIYLNNEKYPIKDNYIKIPKGYNYIEYRDETKNDKKAYIKDFIGEIIKCTYEENNTISLIGKDILVLYLDFKPKEILSDGKPIDYELEIMMNNGLTEYIIHLNKKIDLINIIY
ncbi:hypothetical protein WG909_13895 [Peptostreptococcaceae bacterium AGR-M142]